MLLRMVIQSSLKNNTLVYSNLQLIGYSNVLVIMLTNRHSLRSMIFMKIIRRKLFILNQS